MDRHRFTQVSFGPRWSNVVKYLIIINAAVFVLQEVTGLQYVFARSFGLVPRAFFAGAVWQLVTYMFLHGGFWHILFNMFVLWMFGSA
ncbi:rhomboid family intramembrane serine protease, partial [bacterium]|nr:rhomboid family intramembrane serine protease [bacterium]